MIMKIIFIVCLAFGLLIVIANWKIQRDIKKSDTDYFVQFIKEHAVDNNVSLSINYNDEKWTEVNSNTLLPLASTVKIIVAIEYAQQAAEGKINAQEEVTLKELDTFYVPKTDGGAHEAWISSIKKEHAEVASVPLSKVVEGMIAFSSNANTDYLISKLGLHNINQTIETLDIPNHEPLYPIVSALFIPTQLMKEKHLNKKELLPVMKEMDMSEYRKIAVDIHNQWLNKPITDKEKKQVLKTLNMDIQRIWSDRLPRSTTESYTSIMEKLNNKTYFSKDVYNYLDPVMEQLMQNAANREWLLHAGQKGGSTAFVLTMAMYATDKENNTTELAFFANNLTFIEQAKLSKTMNDFQLKFLNDPAFRAYIKSELSNQ